ncbi:MAG: peptide ABC transporter substrate-binding protein [Candidatus Eremiobacteraeota bacterium]|nr:peptide ABC transporter substrate-binding protein [Candidatus Eremiobacteraeota bacterium]
MTYDSVLKRIAALATAALVLGGCTHAGNDVNGAARSAVHPHELRVAMQGDVDTLNPMLTTDLHTFWPAQLAMAWLLRSDGRNREIPELATAVPTPENGGVRDGGKTITYHLRHDAKWSDGAPFTADDVVFSTNLINDPKTNVVGRAGWDKIVKIDEPDRYTVVFHLKSVYSPFIAQTFTSGGGANPSLVPKHVLVHSKNVNTDPYNALPIGIGPFKIASWERADRIELVRDPLYFGKRPKLDRIVFKIVPNRDTILAEVQTGDIDLWPYAAPAYYARLRAIPGITVVRQPSIGYNHMDFNVSRPAVSDPVVRRALFLAWDRRVQREKVGHGIGLLQDSPFSPMSPYVDKRLGFTERSVAAANALLDRAGWARGADGIRAKHGLRLDIDLASNVGSPDTDTRVELLRQDWKAIGVALTRHNYAPAQLLGTFSQGGIIATGKFDVVLYGSFPPLAGDYSTTFACDQFNPAGANDTRWCDRRADAAMTDFIGTYDEARKRRDDDVLQEEIQRETPTIVQVILEDLFAERSELKNYHPNAVSIFDNMTDVDI